MRKLSFVIPCYGSESTLEAVTEEIIRTVRNMDEYEIILVNDCSPDEVWTVIERLCDSNSRIQGIKLARNFGQHAALMAGYQQCSGDVIISLDDDGQSPVDGVYLLLDELEKGYDVVFASYREKKQNRFRNLGTKINYQLERTLIGMPEHIETSSFFCVKRFVIDEILNYRNPYPYITGLIFRVTKSIGNVPMNHRNREIGRSGYNLRKLFGLWMNGFTAFSVKPLRIATFTGFICSFFGFLFGFIIIIRKLINPQIVVGWSSIVAILVFIGGILMIMLGLIGEYIGRIYISINNSPQYVISEYHSKKQTKRQQLQENEQEGNKNEIRKKNK